MRLVSLAVNSIELKKSFGDGDVGQGSEFELKGEEDLLFQLQDFPFVENIIGDGRKAILMHFRSNEKACKP